MPAIAAHSSATSDAPWSASTNEGRIKTPVSQGVAAHFWAWREGGEWPDTKGGYKFPHHEVSGSGNPGAANMRACSAVIAILNGGRGGANIPDSDRSGVYNHVAKHLKSGGREPPPLGADPDETELWCQQIEAEESEPLDDLEPVGAGSAEIPEMPPLELLGTAAWAIREDVLPRLIEAHRAKMTPVLAAAMASDVHARRARAKATSGGVAVVPLAGILTPRPSLLSILFGGGGGLEEFRENFREAVNSSDVGAVVLDVDSPGGRVSMIPETASEIRDARGSKPIIAVANTLSASAAYWLASQADEVVTTPSGEVGSVGVYMVHEDHSGWNAQKGINPTYISSGAYKTEGNPDESLSVTAKAEFQRLVNEIHDQFVEDVAQGRGTSAAKVRENYGEGRSYRADRARNAGMVDRVDTLGNVVMGLQGKSSRGRARAQSAEERAAIAALLVG
jgi:signal peptide peptidase SppA